MNKRNFDRSPWIVNGFVIAVSISLFVCFGVLAFLSLIKKMELPEHEILIYTVLFYGLVFFIAHSDVRAGTRRNKALISRNFTRDYSGAQTDDRRSAKAVARTVMWGVVTAVSVGWITPALIIYWAAPKNLRMVCGVCCFLFSLAGGTGYLLKTGKHEQTARNRSLFFAGVCAGALGVALLIPV